MTFDGILYETSVGPLLPIQFYIAAHYVRRYAITNSNNASATLTSHMVPVSRLNVTTPFERLYIYETYFTEKGNSRNVCK